MTFRKLCGLTILLTMALVTLGGVVHNTGSSLACPDWPLCFGQVFPKMEGSVAIEHSHRLLASFIGLMVIGLVVLSSKTRARQPGLFKGSLLALALVIFQGVLGGVTVLMQLSPLVSTAHLGTSQIFLATLLWLYVNASVQPAIETPPARVIAGARWAAAAIFIQMLLGAAIRHGGAGVACGLGSEAMIQCLDPMTASATWWPTLAPAQLHMIHRFGGLVSGAILIAGTIPTLRWARERQVIGVRGFAIFAHALWTAQVLVGLLTIRHYIGVFTVTLHLVIAMALWSSLAILNFRLNGARRSSAT